MTSTTEQLSQLTNQTNKHKYKKPKKVTKQIDNCLTIVNQQRTIHSIKLSLVCFYIWKEKLESKLYQSQLSQNVCSIFALLKQI